MVPVTGREDWRRMIESAASLMSGEGSTVLGEANADDYGYSFRCGTIGRRCEEKKRNAMADGRRNESFFF